MLAFLSSDGFVYSVNCLGGGSRCICCTAVNRSFMRVSPQKIPFHLEPVVQKRIDAVKDKLADAFTEHLLLLQNSYTSNDADKLDLIRKLSDLLNDPYWWDSFHSEFTRSQIEGVHLGYIEGKYIYIFLLLSVRKFDCNSLERKVPPCFYVHVLSWCSKRFYYN